MIDPVEKIIEDGFNDLSISFIRDVSFPLKEGSFSEIDFYLPRYDLYIEVCQFHTDRKIKQLAGLESVILIQGKHTAIKFISLIRRKEEEE